jgi:glycosyltransferase involved in cell wall biosynthesis
VRLVILTQYFYPEMGAPQNRLYEWAQELKLLGWDIEIVTAMPNYPTGKIFNAYRGRFYSSEILSGLKTHRYWLYPSKSSRALPRIISMLSFSFTSLFSFFKLRRIKPDYLLVESPPLTLALTGWLLSRLTGSKLIMNVSDLWPLSAKELGAISDGFLYRRLEGLETFLYRRSDLCMGQSQEIVDYIARQKTNNVLLLRNGVDTSRFEKGNELGRSGKIVYAGLLGVAQGILSICKNVNFKEVGIEFHIYGSGNEQEEIEKFLMDFPDRGIQYKGVLKREEIPEVLPQYDATLVALVKNIYGAVPSKIYEAMASGLPIIFSGYGEGATIIREHNLGWTNAPGDWQGLKENLILLRETSDDKLESLRYGARRVARENFDRKTQILRLHHKLVSR